jgi:hypothetical protein
MSAYGANADTKPSLSNGGGSSRRAAAPGLIRVEHQRSGPHVRRGSVRGVEALVQRWSKDAALLRQYRNHQQAEWLEDRAAELEAALEKDDGELLSLTDAASVSGYTADHLGRLMRKGAIKNFGRRNAPKIRRGDLPRKPTLPGAHASLQLVGASKRQVAQAILTSGERR